MKLGAVDYVTKPFDAEELFTVLRKAVQLRELKRENQALREEYEMPAGALSDDPVGASEVMKALFRRASQAAPLDSNILLTGESGTGKGVLARHIHARSGRARGPFITVSCPTLPRELRESELFGHEKGAFTGAMRKRAGKIELAHGGTLFLDEIGDMPLDLQPKLLNVLQDREYQRVGGETTLKADVRVIAATHVDLRDAVKNGAFREDLYYRLGVLTLEVPPLRERDEDVRTLVEHVLAGIARRRKHEGYRIDAAALDRLSGYSWPGNVRQLENVMEQATAFCEAGRVTLSDLPAEIRSEARSGPSGVLDLAGLSLDFLEREALIQTLELAGNNKAETARLLGISEKSVYNMLRRHQLKY